ncbi:YebC/PmpR family DNA-binding transcriptional regulator [Candidatus Amesbacteria bacterium]|nr:YebC/PmpR family DNA-binding transcriptional regulator [Candidatus Amesbacteria bacterium]
MSGHSKWATIHRDKAVNDNKRGVAFTKYAHAITIAAKSHEEYKLRLAIEKAKSINMPKENIKRAIDRATGANAATLEEVRFEGFLPGGVAVMIDGLTDSRLRFAQEIRTILEKGGGTLGSMGCVSYIFTPEPNYTVEISDLEMRVRIENILDKIDDLEDVTEVLTNYA